MPRHARVDAMSEFVFTFPGGSLDLLEGRVLRQGKAVQVEPRARRVLELLVRLRHRVVTKAELLAALDHDGAASDAALRQAVLAARKAIGDDGSGPRIRSIPRVGYIFDVPALPAAPRRAARAARDDRPSMVMGPFTDHTGLVRLRWAARGLSACIAHGLSLGQGLQVQELTLEASWPRTRAQMLRLLAAAGARQALVGSLTRSADGLRLELQIHDRNGRSTLDVTASEATGLVVSAIQALKKVLGVDERRAADLGFKDCAPLSIELFGRAKHCAAVHGHPASLRALELLRWLDPGFPGLALELLRAQAICGSDDGLANAARLLDQASREDDVVLEAQVRHCLGTLHHVRDELREAAQSLQQALVLGRACMPPHWLAHTLTMLASVECRLGELHSVELRLDEAQRIFTSIASHQGLLNLLWLRAIMSSLSGHAEQAIEWNKKLANGARRLRANTTLASACLNLAGELVHADRLEEARAFAEEATATALAIENHTDVLCTAANVHCLLHRLQNRPDAAAELLTLLPQPSRDLRNPYLWAAHGHAAMAAGRVHEASDCFMRAAKECRRCSNRAAEGLLLPWLVEALVHAGRLPAAQVELERADAQPHLQDETTTANLLYPRALLARRRRQVPESQALLAWLSTAPAALALFRRLGQELYATPVDGPGVPALPMAPRNGAMRQQYRFAQCLLDVERRELWIDGRSQTLAPKPFDVFVHLYRNRHRVVSQNELLDFVWDKASGSPEVVAQAIARIRQVLRRSRALNAAVTVQTVYGGGYRLHVGDPAEPHDVKTAALLSGLLQTRPRALVILPLAGPAPAANGDGDGSLQYPLDVVGYAVALQLQLHRLPAAEVQLAIDGVAAATPEAIVSAVDARHPGACVLFARLARHDNALALDFVLASALTRIAGSLRDRSPVALGHRLAARALHAGTSDERALPAVDEDFWLSQMLDLASGAAEEGSGSAALRVLDVILDQEPDHLIAASLRARLVADAFPGGAGRAAGARVP